MHSELHDLIVVGGGPAGLMAAETARARGLRVRVIERMGSAGRKFLIAGKGGLNLTHSEPSAAFNSRYSARDSHVASWLSAFSPQALREWAHELGVPTIIGSSGRVFPSDLKAGPLMRAWLRRLRAQGVEFSYGWRCIGITGSAGNFSLQFQDDAQSQNSLSSRTVVFAMGGGSWAKLGSDGAWTSWLAETGVPVQPLQPSNCGFLANWSSYLKKHAGEPLKPVLAHVGGYPPMRGEAMLTEYGIEGGLIYALSHVLRSALHANDAVTLWLDLCPDQTSEDLLAGLKNARVGQSLSEKLKRVAKLSPAKLALFFEALALEDRGKPERIATRLKSYPLTLTGMRPIDEAISTAGGVDCGALDANLMVTVIPGLFCAGEMLDWDAPTGGYLLSASFASGFVAGQGAARFLEAAPAAKTFHSI